MGLERNGGGEWGQEGGFETRPYVGNVVVSGVVKVWRGLRWIPVFTGMTKRGAGMTDVG